MKPSRSHDRRRPLPFALPVACALLGAAVHVSAQESAADVVAATRHALGWDALAGSRGGVRVEGSARFLGTEAQQTILFDGTGRFVQSFEGPLRQSNGTDGTTTWVHDWTGTARTLVLGDLANAEVSTLFLTGGWTAAGERLRFELAEAAEGQRALAFTHADGVMVGTVRIDAHNHLPLAVSFGTDDTQSTWTFGDYREEGGFAFPGHIELSQVGISQNLETRSIERLAQVDQALFAPRLEAPSDVRFEAAASPELEVKRVPSGHLLVHPLVDGEDLGWFIFDSGAGINCISTQVTGGLPEGPFGEIGARGIGGTVPSHFWRAEELTLGPVHVSRPLFMGLDLGFLEPHFGVPVGGIIGFEFLARCAVELDMREATIALFDPAKYRLPEDGRWEDVLLYGRHPCVRAAFEGHEGVFKIDTGAADDTVTMHYQLVHDLDLVAGRNTTPGKAGGVGGMVGTRVGELASFRLGGHDFGAISASFSLEDKGAFSDDYVWGNIGGKLLEPFVLVFDYPRGRIGFVPRD